MPGEALDLGGRDPVLRVVAVGGERSVVAAAGAEGRDEPVEERRGVARPGRLLNRPSFMGEGVGRAGVAAFGGDFRKAAWGVVGGISYRVSTEATVTINGALTSLWENNLVAVLAEAEYGYVNSDVESFVKYERA